MPLPRLPSYPEFVISLDAPVLHTADVSAVAANLSHPSVVKYLKKLESDLLNDFFTIPLDTFLTDKESHLFKYAFIMGNLNMSQTLLQIHKDAQNAQKE